MVTFEGIAAAADAVRPLVINRSAGLPQPIADKLVPMAGTGSSPVDLIVGFAEAVYSNPAAKKAAKDIAGGCAVLAEQFGFHGMAEESRGSKIAAILDGRDVANAPVPKSEWAEAPAEAAPAPLQPAG